MRSRKNCFGGISIILNREAIQNETYIKIGPKKVGAINGYDAATLYPSCFEQTISSGGYVRQLATNFKPCARLPRQSMYDWLDYESKTRGVEIWHERNHWEVDFVNYRVDGYSKTTGECCEFDGCFYHS